MQVKTCIFSIIGKARGTNQDAVMVKVAETKNHGKISFAAACDGWSEQSGGELASAKALRALERWFGEELPMMIDFQEDKLFETSAITLARLLPSTEKDIKRYARHNKCELDTTISAVMQIGSRYMTINKGDSRIYVIDDKGSRAVTGDESELSFSMGTLSSDATILAATGGFYRKLSEDEIAGSLSPDKCASRETMISGCRRLADKALSRKEKENISVAAMCLEY